MKFAPALAFVVATALTSSVSSKDELVRRRELEGRSGIQWANSDVVMEEHVDSALFVRAPEWGYYESKGSKGKSVIEYLFVCDAFGSRVSPVSHFFPFARLKRIWTRWPKRIWTR